MEDDVGAVKKFIQSPDYLGLSESITRRTKKNPCGDLYDAEVAFCHKSLVSAGVPLTALASLLEQEDEQLAQFCVRLIKSENLLAVGQDFNPMELDEAEDDNEYNLGYSQTFLFSYSIIYLLAKGDRGAF